MEIPGEFIPVEGLMQNNLQNSSSGSKSFFSGNLFREESVVICR
jgi:hypothetical protein